MKTVRYNGIVYRSLADCCAKLNISYYRAVRFIRYYTRCENDPSLAVRWMMNDEAPRFNEQKTWRYTDDRDKSYLRQLKYREKAHKNVIDSMKQGRGS